MGNSEGTNSKYTDPAAELGKPSFLQFFSGLAGEVLIHLGYYENPITRKKTTNLPLARYTLDIMGMLEEKTKGNLSQDEDKYIKAVLYDLRMRFVDASRHEPDKDQSNTASEQQADPE